MISWLGLLRLALANLRINKLRSFLTVLGMVFGTGAVIATLSSNEGASQYIRSELEKLGTNNVTIRTESQQRTFAARDRELIIKFSDLFESISFVSQVNNIQARYSSRVRDVHLLGVEPTYFGATRLSLHMGRFFDVAESQNGLLAVLGYGARKELFKGTSPIGEKIYLFFGESAFVFTVIGTLKEKGGPTGFSVDNGVFVPHRIAEKLSSSKMKTLSMVGTLKNDEHSTKAKEQVLALLAGRFPRGLQVSDAREAIDRTKGIWEKQNLVGICLALISLLTGGVGIMNIMLLSVSQRRKEIGLRKAIGAGSEAILMQFLMESALICLFGGILGILAGMAFGQKVAKLMGQWDAAISLSTVAMALGFAIFTGVLFGLLPAIRASRLDPYDALRAG